MKQPIELRYSKLLEKSTRIQRRIHELMELNEVFRDGGEFALGMIDKEIANCSEGLTDIRVICLHSHVKYALNWTRKMQNVLREVYAPKRKKERQIYPFTLANGLTVLLTSPNEEAPRPYTIGYVHDRRSGNWICTWVNESMPALSKRRRQEIIVMYRALFRVLPEIDRRSVAGTVEVSYNELVALGFMPPVERNEAVAI
jgi:hypothetical protein